jgi:hypothetical protein
MNVLRGGMHIKAVITSCNHLRFRVYLMVPRVVLSVLRLPTHLKLPSRVLRLPIRRGRFVEIYVFTYAVDV